MQDAPAEAPPPEQTDTGASEVPPLPGTAVSESQGRDGTPQALGQPQLMEALSEPRAAETPLQGELVDAGPVARDAALPADAANGPCGLQQSLGPNGECFVALASVLSWADARQACRALGTGWDLASIRNASVNGFVASLLDAEAWIGAQDQAREGTWRWVNDGAVFWRGLADAGSAVNDAYNNWSGSEPNDNRNSDCARILPDQNARWADLECTELRAAVCEGPTR